MSLFPKEKVGKLKFNNKIFGNSDSVEEQAFHFFSKEHYIYLYIKKGKYFDVLEFYRVGTL